MAAVVPVLLTLTVQAVRGRHRRHRGERCSAPLVFAGPLLLVHAGRPGGDGVRRREVGGRRSGSRSVCSTRQRRCSRSAPRAASRRCRGRSGAAPALPFGPGLSPEPCCGRRECALPSAFRGASCHGDDRPTHRSTRCATSSPDRAEARGFRPASRRRSRIAAGVDAGRRRDRRQRAALHVARRQDRGAAARPRRPRRRDGDERATCGSSRSTSIRPCRSCGPTTSGWS